MIRGVGTSLLVDSGADYSMIPRELMEFLGVNLNRCPRISTNSVGDQGEVAVQRLKVTFEQERRKYSFDAPFQCYLDRPGFPSLSLLGREPAFAFFDIRFRMSYTEKLGKVTMHLVEKQRPSQRFLVGGNPI